MRFDVCCTVPYITLSVCIFETAYCLFPSGVSMAGICLVLLPAHTGSKFPIVQYTAFGLVCSNLASAKKLLRSTD